MGRSLVLAGLGEMHLVAHPLDAAFCAVTGLRVIGRTNQLGGRGLVLVAAKTESPLPLDTESSLALDILSPPALAQVLHRRYFSQPTLFRLGIESRQQFLPID